MTAWTEFLGKVLAGRSVVSFEREKGHSRERSSPRPKNWRRELRKRRKAERQARKRGRRR